MSSGSDRKTQRQALGLTLPKRNSKLTIKPGNSISYTSRKGKRVQNMIVDAVLKTELNGRLLKLHSINKTDFKTKAPIMYSVYINDITLLTITGEDYLTIDHSASVFNLSSTVIGGFAGLTTQITNVSNLVDNLDAELSQIKLTIEKISLTQNTLLKMVTTLGNMLAKR